MNEADYPGSLRGNVLRGVGDETRRFGQFLAGDH